MRSKTKSQLGALCQKGKTRFNFLPGKLEEQQIDVHIYVIDSQDAAAAKLNEFAHYVPIPPKERLKSPGDEALLFQGVNTDECMILFRRGNIFVHLNGSSVADAKRFAKHLDDLFRPK
jgi:hypothetical protein